MAASVPGPRHRAGDGERRRTRTHRRARKDRAPALHRTPTSRRAASTPAGFRKVHYGIVDRDLVPFRNRQMRLLRLVVTPKTQKRELLERERDALCGD